MGMSDRRNIGAYLHAEFACAATSQTAGSAASVNGVVVDRLAATYPVLGVAPASVTGGMQEPLSASVVYAVSSTLANTHTLSLDYKIQHGQQSNGSDMADFAVGSSTGALVLTGVSGGGAQNAIVKHDVDLSGAYRYVRVVFQPVFSASSVDTATVTPVFVFGGMAELP